MKRERLLSVLLLGVLTASALLAWIGFRAIDAFEAEEDRALAAALDRAHDTIGTVVAEALGDVEAWASAHVIEESARLIRALPRDGIHPAMRDARRRARSIGVFETGRIETIHADLVLVGSDGRRLDPRRGRPRERAPAGKRRSPGARPRPRRRGPVARPRRRRGGARGAR